MAVSLFDDYVVQGPADGFIETDDSKHRSLRSLFMKVEVNIIRVFLVFYIEGIKKLKPFNNQARMFLSIKTFNLVLLSI